MTNEETKLTKALAICAGDDCDNCPYYDLHQCYDQIKQGAHKLIIKQDQEITHLREKLKNVLLTVDTVKEMNAMVNIHEQIKQAKNRRLELN